MKRNVYDFDHTIYHGDTTVDFYFYCFKKRPWIALNTAASAPYFLGMVLGLVSKTRAKERLYRFFTLLPDIDADVADFWRTHKKKVKGWYLAQKQETDLIISASSEFLLDPICRELGVAMLASRVDKRTGKTEGLNCHDTEKVSRMRAAFPDTEIAAFYSDSKADTPLALLANEAYAVNGTEIRPFFDVFPMKEANRRK